MVLTLVALDGPGDWQTWKLDYHDHTALVGEIGSPHGDGYYGPPKALENSPGVRTIDVESGFFVCELDHATLLRFWEPDARVREAPGEHPPAQAVGKRLDELDASRLYAVVWLEAY